MHIVSKFSLIFLFIFSINFLIAAERKRKAPHSQHYFKKRKIDPTVVIAELPHDHDQGEKCDVVGGVDELLFFPVAMQQEFDNDAQLIAAQQQQQLVDAQQQHFYLRFFLVTCGTILSFGKDKRPRKPISDHKQTGKKHKKCTDRCEFLVEFTQIEGRSDHIQCPFCKQQLLNDPKGYVRHMNEACKPIDDQCRVRDVNLVKLVSVSN